MIISDIHRYVYIGIPRNASKSMNHWLTEHFDGRNYGGHHDYDVPEEATGYLVFTIVRNPYDRAVSSHFAVTWDDQAPEDHELGECGNVQERLKKFRAILETRQKQQKDPPRPSTIPLEQRVREAALEAETEGHEMNQKRFVDLARVNLVLYFERLPDCLTELPFVDPRNVPPFPHHPERGIRPPGTFFDFYPGTDDEEVEWAYAAEDFKAFSCHRYECGLPEDAQNALRIR